MKHLRSLWQEIIVSLTLIKESCVERTPYRRIEVAERQIPFAFIPACADSRVSHEIIFDQWIGDLFVVRVAGNIVSPSNYGVMGSIESC
jgi:carbonic anhydrase